MGKFKLNKSKQGFTIIEVMIVLAIAALILVVVLVAVPQLQKNQRNSARQSVLSRIKVELDNYAGNNNGAYPVANTASGASNFARADQALGFWNRYLGCSGSGASATCTSNVNDPLTGRPVGISTVNGVAQTVVAGTGTGVSIGTPPGSISYALSAVCNGEVLATGSARNYALRIRLEGGALFCIDNK